MGVLIRQDQTLGPGLKAGFRPAHCYKSASRTKNKRKGRKSRNLLKLLSFKHLNNLALSIINVLDYFRNNNWGLMAQLSVLASPLKECERGKREESITR